MPARLAVVVLELDLAADAVVEQGDRPKDLVRLAAGGEHVADEDLLLQVLAKTKQPSAAMDELDATLQLPMGKCMQGVAWRKRGFVLFELGKLKEAYQAYQKSLELDPGNRIAYSELTLLAAEILRSEKLSGDQKRLYAPPPALPGQQTTHCKD